MDIFEFRALPFPPFPPSVRTKSQLRDGLGIEESEKGIPNPSY